MILSENDPLLGEVFKGILTEMNGVLQRNETTKRDFYAKQTSETFEKVVYDALVECSEKTPFKNTIKLYSGHKFPDIVAGKYYGVEVKTTKQQHWKTTGNSVLESTRVEDVSDIYIYFAKLAAPVQFIFRKYEECLYDIAVTHSPRYLIDMDLRAGHSIFDRLGIPYDQLRTLENPVKPFIEYYRKSLKEGEETWWLNTFEENVVPPVVRIFSNLSLEVRSRLIIEAMILFPEIFGPSSKFKYNRISLWLATKHGIVDASLRDRFSAGGQESVKIGKTNYKGVPRVFINLFEKSSELFQILIDYPLDELRYYWNDEDVFDDNRVDMWVQKFLHEAKSNTKIDRKFLVHLMKEKLPQEYYSVVREECIKYDIE